MTSFYFALVNSKDKNPYSSFVVGKGFVSHGAATTPRAAGDTRGGLRQHGRPAGSREAGDDARSGAGGQRGRGDGAREDGGEGGRRGRGDSAQKAGGVAGTCCVPSAIGLSNVSTAALGTQQVCRVPDGMNSANPQALGIPTVSGSACGQCRILETVKAKWIHVFWIKGGRQK